MVLDPDGGAPLREQGPASAAPLSAKRPLGRARVSPWKRYGHAGLVFATARDNEGMTRLAAFALGRDRGTRGLVGPAAGSWARSPSLHTPTVCLASTYNFIFKFMMFMFLFHRLEDMHEK